MPRQKPRTAPTRQLDLPAATRTCPGCARPLWAAYTSRSVVTLDGPVRLAVQVRRCRHPDCPRYRAPLRSEQEGRHALPQHEFGLESSPWSAPCGTPSWPAAG
jgi:hypothetical protein